jgi:hypothetical protein
MKYPSIVSVLFMAVVLASCSSCTEKKVDGTATVNADSLASAIKESEVKGTWVIRAYYFGEISAMDEKTAKEWMDRKLVIADKLYFDFDQVRSYREEFRGQLECDVMNIDSPEIILASEHFDPERPLFSDLKLDSSMIKVYKTSCPEHPFSEFILTGKSELIFTWDGAFFVLNKERNI